jgi:hypothetical protein
MCDADAGAHADVKRGWGLGNRGSLGLAGRNTGKETKERGRAVMRIYRLGNVRVWRMDWDGCGALRCVATTFEIDGWRSFHGYLGVLREK